MPNPLHSTASGLDLHEDKRVKQPVRAASTANVSLSAPGASMDGVTLASGDRALLKNQTLPAQNGIYTWTGAATTLTRSLDADAAADFVYGFLVYVREGTINAASYQIFTTSTTPLTLETTSITFVGVGAGAITDPTTTRGDFIVRGAAALARLAIGAVGKFIGSDGTDPLWTNTATHFATSGLTGAVAPARFVGGTTSGAPITGTFAVGDYVIDATGKVWITTGAGSPGTWTQAGGGMANPMTTNQDLIVGGASGVPARLGIGANGQALQVVSGVVTWTNPTSGFANPMTQIGDMMTGTTGGTAVRLAIGAGGQVLTVVGGQPGWANPAGGGGGGTNNNVASSLYLAANYI